MSQSRLRPRKGFPHLQKLLRLGLVGLVLTSLGLVASGLIPNAQAETRGFADQPIVNVRVNFQDAPTEPPAGYFRDFGQPYGLRSGKDFQGCDWSYGWVTPGTSTPLDLQGNGRNRNNETPNPNEPDLRLATLMHMQLTGKPEGAWEIAIPNGTYRVTVGVGDARSGVTASTHRVNVEGINIINNVVLPSGTTKYASNTLNTVVVADSKLTLDAIGGSNTKINYVDIIDASADPRRPYVTNTNPPDCETDVSRDSFISADVHLPTVGAGVDDSSLKPNQTVKLYKTNGGAPVAGAVNTSGGGDVIVFQPTGLLDANTQYTFEINGVKDLAGRDFLPYKSTFTTGTAGTPSDSGVAFTKLPQDSTNGKAYTTLVVGPDGKLYAATILGEIVRFTIGADGALSNPQSITSLTTYEGGPRAIVGMVFDPASTPTNPILWVSHGVAVLSGAPDWTSKISKLSGANLQNVQPYVVGLPRAVRDHLTESLVFGPGGALYVPVGSNSSMGAPDNAWGQRPERLLSATILRIDPTRTTGLPINVQTAEGGSYNPYAAGAPVTIYATGIRNAFDLVYHSNGQLYAPANGAGSDGNTPATPDNFANLPQCQNRSDGPYTGPAVPGLTGVQRAQPDYLFRIAQGGYYGHPNPERCEWVLNGGNPTPNPDYAQEPQYPNGTQPDRNYRGYAFNFGLHYSPNGAIEYKSNLFGGALKGRLLVVRYSGGDDIIVLTPGGPNGDISKAETGIQGFTGFNDPLDITEHTATGNLYVSEYGGQRILLLKPRLVNLPVKRYMPIISNGTPSLTGGATTPTPSDEDVTIDPRSLLNRLDNQSVALPGLLGPSLLAGSGALNRRRRGRRGRVLVGTLVVISLLGAPQSAPTVFAAAPELELENLDGAPSNTRLVFNRIQNNPETLPDGSTRSYGVHDRATLRLRNTGTAPLIISNLTVVGPWQRDNVTLPATVAAGKTLDITLRFTASDLGPTSSGVHAGTLTVTSNDSDEASTAVDLAGYWQNVSEGGQEPTLGRLIRMFGYTTRIVVPGQQLFNKGQVAAVGEEVLSPYWRRADTAQPVRVRQIAAFHGNDQGQRSFLSWHPKGSDSTTTVLGHAATYGQSVLPPKDGSAAPALASFTPTGATFGFMVDGEWSDPAKNNQEIDRANGCPVDRQCGHHMRFWPLRDQQGTLVPDTYLMAMDVSGVNYDYQDNVYVISNITPETPPTVAPVLRDTLHRLDVAGAGTYMDRNGFDWTPDSGTFTPANAPNEPGNADPDVQDTNDDIIYRTYRGNTGSQPRVLTYNLPVGSQQKVDLRLHFAERYTGNNAPGKRVFDILAEGKILPNSDPVLDGENFDIFAASGGVNTAKILSFNNVAVTDGQLTLELRAEADYPSIAGIEVLCQNTCLTAPGNLPKRGWLSLVYR